MVSYSFEGNKRLWTARDEEENEKIFGQQSKPTGVKIPIDIKPTYLANAECEMEKWPLVHLMRLLRFYAAHRCLWDVGCKDNRNRKMRQAAIADITAAMDTGVTKQQVVQKINILRNTYRYEKKRIKQRIRRGLGARTKLKWFALADAFLRKVPKKVQKDEDPTNSDSDLEDTIVFTINPESLMPLDQEFTTENFQQYQNNDNSFENDFEIFSDCSPYNPAADDTENMVYSKTLNKNRIEEFARNKNESGHDRNSSKNKTWNLQDTLRFLQLLENHSVFIENAIESCAFLQITLETIARKMNRTYKSIEKRWLILQKVCMEEKQKILDNIQYKPKYKWWAEAERLFLIKANKNVTSAMAHKDDATESIFLNETTNLQNINDSEEYENRFLQNPIPSVAPLSNMNEAMESLFHTTANDGESLSQESNTDSSFPKENESTSSGKFVWHGLDDDLLEGKWSLRHSVKFLRLYGAHRCLWDLKDTDYRSRPLRNAAMEDIAASMGYGLTASYVAKKIKIFRITYMQQRKRILEATEKGEKPEILLKWFPLADSFLRPHIGLRSIKSDAKEIPQFDFQYVYANLNLIDPALLNDFRGKGTQNAIEIGNDSELMDMMGA